MKLPKPRTSQVAAASKDCNAMLWASADSLRAQVDAAIARNLTLMGLNPSMATTPPLPTLLQDQLEPLRLLCLRHGVLRLEVFVSAASGAFYPSNSDLDFIVQMQGEREPGYSQRFCRFAQDLESLYRRPVDLLTEQMIRIPYFKAEVERTRRPLVEVADAA